MSNELVYGDASIFVGDLEQAEASARDFYDSVVTYLSGCVKTLTLYREGLGTHAGADTWKIQINAGDGVFNISSNYAELTLLRSHPPGTVRFLIVEKLPEGTAFTPRAVQGFITFAGSADEAGTTHAANKKTPAVHSGDGMIAASFKTDSAASFAEPLFAQLFAPIPISKAAVSQEEAG